MRASLTCLTAIGLVLMISGAAQAQEDNPEAVKTPKVLDTLTVIGFAGGADQVAGSVDFLDLEALELQGHTDALRALRVVPGGEYSGRRGIWPAPQHWAARIRV